MMIKNIAKLFIIFIFFSSCSNIQKQRITYKILTPKSDWSYYSDSFITFSTNINADEMQWFSDKDGYLGNGNGFTARLSSGNHEIKAIFQDSEANVTIAVENRIVKRGQTLKYLINANEQQVLLPPGEYKTAVVALEGSVTDLTFIENKESIEIKKDINLSVSTTGKACITDTERYAVQNIYRINDEKSFYVINTKQQNLEPHYIDAKVIRTSDSYNIWYPVNPEELSKLELDENLLNDCISEIENRIIPRLNTLWGDLPDIDNDGKISFLFTPTINEEQTAIGFFNPDDFYKRDEFSPYSNEMDLLYIAIPEADNFSYSTKCISATIAHELTHAINYNIKTYSRVLANENNPPQEETFLDEAESHLSESLCGYGLSGGNISTLWLYLNNQEKYSVCRNDYLGNGDSNGQRGAATMFLSWLFWKKGGITWNKNNLVEIVDNGGISFIKSLVASNGTGWENIGRIFGKSTDALYVQMVEELNASREFVNPSLLDPYSLEPVQLYPDYQTYSLKELGKVWKLSVPVVKTEGYVSLIPYSFILLDIYDNDSDIILSDKNVTGQVIGLFCKE